MNTAKKIFLRWEWLLAVLIVGVYVFFNKKMPDSYTFSKLLDQTRVYMVDVGFLALGAFLVLLLGDIDISVGSTAALSVTVMAVTYNGILSQCEGALRGFINTVGGWIPFLGISFISPADLAFCIALPTALLTGIICGLINGVLVTRFKELFPMIITLSTMTLYRGIAYIILKDKSSSGFPSWFSKGLGYDSLKIDFNNIFRFLGGPDRIQFGIPIMLVCLLALFPIFYIWLHHTSPGRRIFATGTNITTARYSGVRTDRMKLYIFALNGLLAAVGGIFLSARTNSVKYTLATGYEMQAIAVAVLGGASTAGGKGTVVGLLLSLILMTCLKNGLTVAYNDSFILNLAIGVLLITVVLLPNIVEYVNRYVQVYKRRQAAAVSAAQK